MRPPIISYLLFLEEFFAWLLNPIGICTLSQFLALRVVHQFNIPSAGWIQFLAPGVGLFFFFVASKSFIAWVRQRVFAVVPTRIALITMRMALFFWFVLSAIFVYAGAIVFHIVANPQQGDLVELYISKPLIFTLVTAITLYQLMAPSTDKD